MSNIANTNAAEAAAKAARVAAAAPVTPVAPSTAAAETSWNNALELAGRAAAANDNNRSLTSKTVVTMSQQNINAKAAANARVAEGKKMYEEQEVARLKRNINAAAFNLKCSSCEQQIIAKLDTLLTQSKPTFATAFNSANKTVQSALEATAVGLN